MKKLLSLCLCTFLGLTLLTGCGSKDKELPHIGVVQIVEHKSLNIIRDSFKDEMAKLGYVDGENCIIDFENAGGEPTNANSIVTKFKGDNVDVIVAIATPTAQAAATASKDIPVIFSAVTDPIASGLTSSLEKPDKNITGTSDEIQVDQILDFALTIQPDAKTMGVIYNASETNSVTNINKAKKYAKEHNLKVEEVSVVNVTDMQSAAQVLCEKVDFIFTPNDNTVASGMTVLSDIAKKAKVPVYTGADSMVMDGGFASVGIDYEDLGRETARMTVEVLKGTNVKDLPVKVFKTDLKTFINKTTAKELGITIPEEILNAESTRLFD